MISKVFCHILTKNLLVRSLIKPGFHLQQTLRPPHKQSDYVIEQSSFPLIALFRPKIGPFGGRNWLNGNQALAKT